MIKQALSSVYRATVRPLLPTSRYVRYAGINGPYDIKLGHDTVGRIFKSLGPKDKPDHERGLVTGIARFVRPGDRVVVVGGGIGITAAHAALAAGGTGHVTCYEGDVSALPAIRVTLERNKVADRVTLVEAIVGSDIAVYGTSTSVVVDAAELPECDVLELDCEGAEKLILAEMQGSPRVILVETHGLHGAPSDETRAVLRAKGYDVHELGVAEPEKEAFCRRTMSSFRLARATPPEARSSQGLRAIVLAPTGA